jgi:hypothetical protein
MWPYRAAASALGAWEDEPEAVDIRSDDPRDGGRWLEATHRAPEALYGWYHLELANICPDRPDKEAPITTPEIGAMVSYDDGASWLDLGIILRAPGGVDCNTGNDCFGGGEGDFSVLLDQQGEYLYFLFTAYHHDPAEQGVAIARMLYADRQDPVGKVQKWYQGAWKEPGLDGSVTPIFPVQSDWHQPGPTSAFWGPSVHWNTHLERYVVLLNHAVDHEWQQEGVYVSFNADLADPSGWSQPQRILEVDQAAYEVREHAFYPQVLGQGPDETDKLAGRTARLFLAGTSSWELRFLQSGEGPR